MTERPAALTEYWGLGAIAQRMGVSRPTIINWYEHRAFLMFQRRRGPRSYWYTTEQMILLWQTGLCVAYREAWLKVRATRRPHPVR